MAKLHELIDFHLAYYKDKEKENFDRATSYYRGDFWAPTESKGSSDLRLSDYYAQKNMVYAVTETAISSLLGPNPQVAAIPQSPESQDLANEATALLAWIFKKTQMRRRCALALMDSTLRNRGIFKTTWDAKNDRPKVSIPQPGTVFFDLSARDIDDIRYWIHAVPMRPVEFARRVKSGKYKPHKDIKAQSYPRWMMEDGQDTSKNRFDSIDKRILVYEYYDIESNKVIHFHHDTKHVLFEGRLDYCPFDMFSLNHSGVDCTGLSEVQLILDQQANINQLLTLWKRIVYLQVPKILYDSGKISSGDLDKAMEAMVGSFVPVDAESTGQEVRNLGAYFYEMPRPEVPQSVIQFIERLEGDAAFQSALAEAARGQVAGAKTATEMAIIDAQMRTRLATREGHLHNAIEGVANKMFYLIQRFMRKPKMVRVAGGDTFALLRTQDIRELEMDFTMVAYNPMRQNPAVILETLQAMVPILAQAPNINTFKLFEELVRGLGLPNDIVIPEQQAKAAQAQAAQAQAAVELEKSKGGAATSESQTEMGAPMAEMPAETQAAVQDAAVQQGMSPPQ